MERLGKVINVTIVFDSAQKRCEGQCGLDWSSEETGNLVRRRISERFDDTVNLELLDLSKPGQQSASIKKRFAYENVQVPSLLVDNEIRIPGEFDVRQLLDAIEVEQEING